jgi:hypothetical protein
MGTPFALELSSFTGDSMTALMLCEMLPLAAAGWAFLVWLFGGGFGLAVIVFIILKVLGK